MRKDVLDQAGGLIAFAQYIAEDYFMAKAIADRYDIMLHGMLECIISSLKNPISASSKKSTMVHWSVLLPEYIK